MPRRLRRVAAPVLFVASVALSVTGLGVPPAAASSCFLGLFCPPPPAPPPAAATTPLPDVLLAATPAGVPAGDYLLSATLSAGAGTIQAEIAQQEGGAGALERNADAHVGTTPQLVTAEVRVTGPSDLFVIRGSGPGQATGFTLTAAGWSYLVRGQRITGGGNNNVVWHGVNSHEAMSSTDFATLQQSTRANFVRVPVSEVKWLPYFTAMYEAGYRQHIIDQVNAVIAQGMVAMISLGGAGHDQPLYQPQPGTQQDQLLPDQHSLAFWDDAMSVWAGNPHVVFEAFNEPLVVLGRAYAPDGLLGEKLWRDGGRIEDTQYTGDTWTAPGEQQLVDRIRADGSTNLVMVNGMAFGGDLRAVETNPIDATNLDYSFHAYTDPYANENPTTYPAHLDYTVSPLQQPSGAYQYAVFCSEFGTTEQDTILAKNGSKYLGSTLSWLGARDLGWAAWGWYPYLDNYQLLTGYQPLKPNSKGQTVINWL